MGYGANRLGAAILALIFLMLAGGCATQATQGPRRTSETASSVPAPDVRKHLIGPWWREHRSRLEGLRLGSDGKLEVVGVHEMRGAAWRVDGRKLFVRMRDTENGDLYEDELYIRRLTDRTLIVEAGDSYFAGTYGRHRPTDVQFEPRPQPVSQAGATRDGQVGDTSGAESFVTGERVVLRAVTAEALEPRGAWLTVVADLANCGQQLNRSSCPRFYVDEAASLLAVEVCQPGRILAEGVHFIDKRGGQASFPWFDTGFGRFVCDNGCNQGTGCRYEVTARSASGRPTEVMYHFEVGVTYGWVRLRLGSDGSVQVIGRELRTPPQ